MLRELAVKWLLLPAQESTGMSVMNEIDDTISCLFARAQYGTTYVTSCWPGRGEPLSLEVIVLDAEYMTGYLFY